MKLLILESFCYELHVVYCYFMFHLKLDLYVSAFPTIVFIQMQIHVSEHIHLGGKMDALDPCLRKVTDGNMDTLDLFLRKVTHGNLDSFEPCLTWMR